MVLDFHDYFLSTFWIFLEMYQRNPRRVFHGGAITLIKSRFFSNIMHLGRHIEEEDPTAKSFKRTANKRWTLSRLMESLSGQDMIMSRSYRKKFSELSSLPLMHLHGQLKETKRYAGAPYKNREMPKEIVNCFRSNAVIVSTGSMSYLRIIC